MADTAANCTACGSPMDPGSAYCVSCGAGVPAMPAGGQAPGSAPPPSMSPPPPPPQSLASPSGGVALPLTQRSFFSSLFDLSFTSLVGPKIIKVLYVLSIILIGLTALFFVLAAFNRSAGAGVVVLFIVAPIASLFYLVYARVLLELFIALFRIMENTSELVAQGHRNS
jgi:hypothetical protein